MKGRDVFGIFIRLIGLCILIVSLLCLAYGTACLSNVLQDTTLEIDMRAYFLFGGPGFLCGLILLRFGRAVVHFCYPEDKEDSET